MIHFNDSKRPLLYSLIVSVVLGALLGIIVVFRNTWGWFEIRVMLTSLTVAGASLCGLACDLSRTRGRIRFLPNVALIMTLVSTGMILAGVWLDLDASEYWKTTSVASIFTAALVQTCLLSIADLARRFRWVFGVSCLVAFGIATLVSSIVIGNDIDQAIFRFTIAFSIVNGALTLVIPLLHRISLSNQACETGRDTGASVPASSVRAIDAELATLRQRIRQLETIRSEVVNEEAELT